MAPLDRLTDHDFDATVQNAQGPVLVDFSATWCQPCKALVPTIEAIAREFDGRLSVYVVDVDAAAATADRFGVLSYPTCILFQDGKEIDRFHGGDVSALRSRVAKAV